MITRDEEDLVFEGMTVQQYHEQLGCPKRLVPCPNMCHEWVVFDTLDEHVHKLCVKRPAKPILCRLGCGASFGGLTEQLLEVTPCSVIRPANTPLLFQYYLSFASPLHNHPQSRGIG